ncbi:MAG: ATPase domain-containing protein [Candidatus Diapherotrites archaeon]
MDRVQTGIKGFDELVQGGIPRGSTVLLGGGAGTCKTIFGIHFIYQGAVKFNEPGLYVTLESNVKNITWNLENFGWDVKKLQDKNMVRVYKLNLNAKENVEMQIDAELDAIAQIVKEMGAKRIVVDSTTAFAVWIKEPGAIRSLLYRFTEGLKELGCTSLLISETKGMRNDFSAFGVEEFVADAVIALYFTPPHRSIFVRKMRGTNHSKGVHPFEITNTGLDVKPKDEILWDAIK